MGKCSSSPPARLALAGSIVLSLGAAGAAHAQTASSDDLEKIRAELARQAQVISAQQAEIDELRAQRDEILAAIRGTGANRPALPGTAPATSAPAPSGQRLAVLQTVPNPVTERPPVTPVTPNPTQPVGERPPEQPRADAEAIPPGLGVLTPKGRLVLDPSVTYARTSNNRLVFRGIELVAGINIGALAVSQAARDTTEAAVSARYGLTNRLEVEARAPYVWRHDRLNLVAQRDQTLSQVQELDGQSIGDVELAARYQLNYGRGGWPIFVANARVKTPTGTGPYDVRYDADGVAQELATGSGFWGLETGVTMLYPTDPAIVFAGINYLHNFERDINKTFGSGDDAVTIRTVEPGSSIGASLGFGLSLNPRFSVSFGYSHNYIFPTRTNFEQKPGQQATGESIPLVVGSMLMGWSFRLTERLTLNNSFEIGVTSDAPDVRIVFRAPYRF
jgi:hypothetical protein